MVCIDIPEKRSWRMKEKLRLWNKGCSRHVQLILVVILFQSTDEQLLVKTLAASPMRI
jgi:hypothetical protein